MRPARRRGALGLQPEPGHRLPCGRCTSAGRRALLQLGFAYDRSALSESHRGPSLPIDQQLRFGLGVLWAVTDTYTLGFAYEYANLGSAPINTTRSPLTGTLQGDYTTNTLNVLEFTVSHRF
jgi:long-subunit fatty acid transport protein